MLFLQASLCFAGNGLAILLAILLIRDGRAFAGAWVGAALFLCSIGYSLTLLPPPLKLPDPWYPIAAFINVPTLGLNLLFARALLIDDFRFGRVELAVLVALSVIMFVGARPLLGIAAPRHDLAMTILEISGLIVMAHILWIAASGFTDDLVQSRRRLRVFLVLFSLASFVIIGVIEARGMSIVAEGIAFDASTVAITLAMFLWLTRLDASFLFADAVAPPMGEAPNRAVPPAFEQDRAKLVSAMEKEELWRREDLTVGTLASHIGMAEHHLRALINAQMGYRNFSVFLNGYRLQAAKSAMRDPINSRTPILTIALESGFGSLSTFNRAFKSLEGTTPSNFRAHSFEKV